MEFWFVRVVFKYMNCSTLSKELLPIFTLWLLRAFWSRDMTMYLVLSEFTSRPISLLSIGEASVSLYSTHAPVQYINITSINQIWCVPFKSSWFILTLLMAYSKTKLKINCYKASPCFLVGKMSDKANQYIHKVNFHRRHR